MSDETTSEGTEPVEVETVETKPGKGSKKPPAKPPAKAPPAAKKPVRIDLPIAKLLTGPAEAVRAGGPNQEYVDRYADCYADKERREEMPPVDVFASEGNAFLGEGRHRVMAASQAGLKSINCLVRTFKTKDEAEAAAIVHAAGCNETHGLNRSPSDKRAALATILPREEFATSSDRDIAALCRVHKTLVRLVREEMSAEGKLTGKAHAKAKNYKPEAKLRGNQVSDGKGGITAAKPAEEKTTEEKTASTPATSAPPSQPVATESVKELTVEEMIDAGRRLMNEVRVQVGTITEELASASSEPWGAAVGAILSTVARDLKNVTENVSLSVPAYQCPMGCGVGNADCGICTGRGWITRHGFHGLNDVLKSKCKDAKEAA